MNNHEEKWTQTNPNNHSLLRLNKLITISETKVMMKNHNNSSVALKEIKEIS